MKQLAFFWFHLVGRCVERRAAVLGFTFFNLVIRLSNVKQLAFFQLFTCRSSVETTCRCSGLHLFSGVCFLHSGIRTCLSGVVSFFLVTLVRFKCARNSRVDNVSRPWVYLTLWPLSPNRGTCMTMWMHHVFN